MTIVWKLQDKMWKWRLKQLRKMSETRKRSRVLRSLPNTRRKLSTVVFRNIAQSIYPSGTDRDNAVGLIPSTPVGVIEIDIPRSRSASKSPIAEVDAYFYLLLLVKLIDEGDIKRAAVCSESLMSRIKAAKLEYSDAHKHLVQALRKAPQNAAVGFRQTVQKLIIVVELLLGNIPERQVFRQAALRKSLAPYFQLTQAVRLSVKAMRYPPKSYGKDLESAEERREREQQDLELAKEMAEDDEDGF
ncbi:unnamed protein product [Ceratitis capitata]|uniref:(Mediterranean fruit fly) hypothetical protein n=1 Tax=Ceratitis capitata TaxID=7213 RepID=A0A811UIL9_CERCA|nr:unnamed protein product [Ceratitis capitata]